MKSKWRAVAFIVAALILLSVGVLAIVAFTGYQCCNSEADGEAARLADRTPSVNQAALAAGPQRISIYSVSLRCPLVSSLGCGSEAKPIMKALQNQPMVEGTWLNHAGTSLAVLWSAGTDSAGQLQSLSAAFQDHQMPGELSGDAREVALRDFFSGVAWYRPDAIDQLSAQEADVVARRWVAKITSIIPMPERVRAALRQKLSDEMRCRFVNG
jgi:hypothetical protein